MLKPLVALLGVAGCGWSNTSGNTLATCTTPAHAAARPTAFTGTVFTIVMENKSRHDILGNKHAPFINQLAHEGAVAAGYHDSYVHPSEPNYLWMAGGQNFGILDDGDPAAHPVAATWHIADQIEQAGLTWKAYQESMGERCGLVSHGRYAAKHDPFVYFTDLNGWDGHVFHPTARCSEHVVDYSELDRDIAAGTLPRYVFITPNLDNDMHDGSIARGDLWLSNEVSKIMATPAYRNGGVLFLLWDEGSGVFGPGDDPPFIVSSPLAKVGTVSRASYDTSSYYRTVQAILGLPEVECGGETASVMSDLFAAPLDSRSARAPPLPARAAAVAATRDRAATTRDRRAGTRE